MSLATRYTTRSESIHNIFIYAVNACFTRAALVTPFRSVLPRILCLDAPESGQTNRYRDRARVTIVGSRLCKRWDGGGTSTFLPKNQPTSRLSRYCTRRTSQVSSPCCRRLMPTTNQWQWLPVRAVRHLSFKFSSGLPIIMVDYLCPARVDSASWASSLQQTMHTYQRLLAQHDSHALFISRLSYF